MTGCYWQARLLPIIDSDAPEILQGGQLQSTQHINAKHDRRNVMTTPNGLSQLLKFAAAKQPPLVHLSYWVHCLHRHTYELIVS